MIYFATEKHITVHLAHKAHGHFLTRYILPFVEEVRIWPKSLS